MELIIVRYTVTPPILPLGSQIVTRVDVPATADREAVSSNPAVSGMASPTQMGVFSEGLG